MYFHCFVAHAVLQCHVYSVNSQLFGLYQSNLFICCLQLLCVECGFCVSSPPHTLHPNPPLIISYARLIVCVSIIAVWLWMYCSKIHMLHFCDIKNLIISQKGLIWWQGQHLCIQLQWLTHKCTELIMDAPSLVYNIIMFHVMQSGQNWVFFTWTCYRML